MLDQFLASHLWGLQLDDIQESEDTIVLWLTATRLLATCPVCHHSSCHVQSRYQRVLADVACLGLTVRLCLHVRRFFCCNPACTRKVFCERLPDLVMPSARCTKRLAELQRQVALEIGGEVGQRLLRRFAIHVSANTLRRSRQPSVTIATPRVLGVDDYATRKGQSKSSRGIGRRTTPRARGEAPRKPFRSRIAFTCCRTSRICCSVCWNATRKRSVK